MPAIAPPLKVYVLLFYVLQLRHHSFVSFSPKELDPDAAAFCHVLVQQVRVIAGLLCAQAILTRIGVISEPMGTGGEF